MSLSAAAVRHDVSARNAAVAKKDRFIMVKSEQIVLQNVGWRRRPYDAQTVAVLQANPGERQTRSCSLVIFMATFVTTTNTKAKTVIQ
jgi:hypothetical protein